MVGSLRVIASVVQGGELQVPSERIRRDDKRKMKNPGLNGDTHRKEKSKIAKNLTVRVRQCMTKGDEPQIFAEAMNSAQITPAHLDGSLQLEHNQLNKLVDYAIRQVPDLTLRVFAQADLSDLGVIGYAAAHSETVSQAMNFLLRYHELTSDRYIDNFSIEGDLAIISPTPLMPYVSERRNIVEESFSGYWRVLTLLLGENFDLSAVKLSFAYAEPDYEQTYRDIFCCSCRFDAKKSELQFPAQWLSRKIDAADDVIAEVCATMCERLLGAGHSYTDTVQSVRRLLLNRPNMRMYRLEEAAQELGLSSLQLRKRLYREGSSYKKLVLENRMSLAKHYLEDTNLSIQEIAYLLDYSQSAPFGRAFKAYFGVSPDRNRSNLQQGN
jgi:AraC-like DNA-binding protein